MTYVVNKSRDVELLIHGVNYTNNVLSIELSDDSAVNNGIVTTSGTIVLGYVPGGASIADYDKNFFLRGRPVIINVANQSGTLVRHPRGHLYVVETSYDIEANQLSVEVGCKLYLASISDDVSELIGYTTLTLNSEQQTFSDLSSALQAESKFIWQNNQGAITKTDFFDGDGLGTNKAPGEWLSKLGETTISAEALGGGSIPPDVLELSFDYVVDQTSTINPEEDFERSTVVTKYTIDYPAVEYVRVKPENGLPGTAPGGQNTIPNPGGPGRGSDTCGDSPVAPPDSEGDPNFEACTDGYNIAEVVRLVGVESTEISTTYYQGPGRQISKTTRELYNAKLEHNSDYWKDLIEFCRFGFGTTCKPDGACLGTAIIQGQQQMRDNIVIEQNYYGEGGILTRKVVETYTNMLDCYSPYDWRYKELDIFNRTEISKFRQMHLYTGKRYEYMSSRVDTQYEYFDSHTIETVTTWTSDCGKEGQFYEEDDTWIRRIIDAFPNGKKRVVQTITSNNTPEREEQKSSDPTVVTANAKISDVRSAIAYVEPPTESGRIVMQTSIPIPIATTFNSAITLASKFLLYYRRFLEGDNRGVRVVESLRDDIRENFRPSMPFYFYDARNDELLTLRMDACSWGMTLNECIVSTDGIFVGSLQGEVFEGPSSISPPFVLNPSGVTPAAGISEVIQVNLALGVIQENGGGDSVTGVISKPVDTYFNNFTTLVIYVSGAIFGPGSLIAADANGTVPISNGSTLVTTGATVIEDDLFAS